MPKTILAPSGSGFTMTTSEGSVDVVDYGVQGDATVLSPATSLALTTHDLPNSFDSAEVILAPEVGHAHINKNGKLVVALYDVMVAPTDPLEVVVAETTGASTVNQLYTIPVEQSLQLRGPIGGDAYRIKRDANGLSVVEEAEDFFAIHISSSTGFTKAEVEAREGIADARQSWFRDNFAMDSTPLGILPGEKGYNPGGIYKYGQTPELAMDEDRGVLVASTELGYAPCSAAIRFKSGDTFDIWNGPNPGSITGRSPLHPIIMEHYGVGARPRMNGSLNGIENCIIRGLDFGTSKTNFINVEYLIIEDCIANTTINVEGKQQTCRYCSYNKFVSFDSWFRPPPTVLQWPVKPSREQGVFGVNVFDLTVEKSVFDIAGWAPGYDPDGSSTSPQPPTQFSHIIYISGYSGPVSFSDCFFSRPSLTAIQGRSGIYVNRCATALANLGFQLAGGPDSDDTGGAPNQPSVAGSELAASSIVDSTLIVGAGYKTQNRDNFAVARAFRVGGGETHLNGNVVLNSGPGNDGTIAHGGPVPDDAISFQGIGRVRGTDDTVIWDWLGTANANPDSVATGTLDGLTLQAFIDDYTGTTGKTYHQFMLEVRAGTHDPFDLAEAYYAFFMTPLGRMPVVPGGPGIRVFSPPEDGSSYGCRSDQDIAWEGAIRPGRVAGDSIDLDGYPIVRESYAYGNDIVNLDLKGSTFEWCGDRQKFTGDILSAGNIITKHAGELTFGDTTVAAGVNLEARGGRIAMEGAFSGPANILVRGRGQAILGLNGGSTTLTTGGRLEIAGNQTFVGFDGQAGATSTLTAQAGSTVRFTPVVRIPVDGINNNNGPFFNVGEVITTANGFSGTLVRIERVGPVLYLDNCSGPLPVNNEPLSGIGWYKTWPTPFGQIGLVNGTPTVSLGMVRKGISGYFGDNAPVQTCNVVITGTVEVDTYGLAPGSIHDLINVDGLTTTGASLPDGAVNDGSGKLVLTVN